MRIQIIGTPDSELYDVLADRLDDGKTFSRVGTRKKNAATFRHKSYHGTVSLRRGWDDVVLADAVPGDKDKKGSETLGALVGFLCRHLAGSIYTVSIQFD